MKPDRTQKPAVGKRSGNEAWLVLGERRWVGAAMVPMDCRNYAALLAAACRLRPRRVARR